ncbi:MAG: LptF/LptG family permease [Bacteroidales bacterium]|nr:LptF/LptG family permease [Bacteroidales bacterium]MBN2698200.1 LptF/LptG family permease [Bacteroidales bacterium]
MERKLNQKIKYKIINLVGLKIIDFYIIRKFLGTFFLAIILILSIAVIFDLSEKIDDFIENEANWKEVVFQYYLNFIPYFAVLFSSLFAFIAVIYFTSRMAYNTEITAILSSGMSFRRMLIPYLISATIIASLSFFLSDRVIPQANKIKLDFENKYIHQRPVRFDTKNFHRQIEPGVFVYLQNYSNISQVGYSFSIEKFENGELVSKMIADQIRWDTATNKWSARRYYIRTIDGLNETIEEGRSLDTALNIHPDDFKRRLNIVETMSLKELDSFISQQIMQGETNVKAYQIERHKRISFPFSTFILTFIGVAVSSRKLREGIGLQIAIGVVISFTYILFIQFSSQYAIGGLLPVALAVWLPNIFFLIVALFLFRLAPN